MPGPYSAGTIFLQVVPSFRDVQNLARKNGREVGRAWGEGYDAEAGQGLERAMTPTGDTRRAAKTLGADSGDQAGRSFADSLQKQINRSISRLPKLNVTADTSDADRQIQALRARLVAIKDAHVKLEIDSGEALREMAQVQAALVALSDQNVDIDVKVNAREAIKDIAVLGGIAAAAAQDRTINFDADTGAAIAKIEALGVASRGAASDGSVAANSFRLFSGAIVGLILLGPILIPIIAALAGGMLALGTAAVGAVAGLGILVVAFSGIGNALTAMGNVQKNGAKDALTASKAISAAANSVADAERGLQRAREQAARSEEDAARRVADAKRSLADAERAAKDATRSALEERRRAELSLADAQRASKKAQDDLVDARRKAQDQLEDLALAQRGGSLAERQAVLDVADAKKELDRVNSRPAASPKAVEEANIAYQRAVLALEQIRIENGRLAEEKADADKKGVEGSDLVKTAQERILDTTRAQIEAQQTLAKANQNVTRTQIENSRKLADAQRNVTDAVIAQQRAAADGANGIADAQRGLQRAQQGYADTVKSSADIGSASVRNLNDAMNKLGPAGQNFVRFLFGLRGQFYALRDAIQQGVLPGIQDALTTIIDKYGPGFLEFARTMGATLGDIFRQAAKVFTNPAFQQFFSTMARLAPVFLTQFATITLNIIQGLAGIMNAFAPFAKDFGDILIRLTGRFAKWAGSLDKTKGFQDFVKYLHGVMPAVGKLLTNFVDAFLNLAEGLAPYAGMLLKVFSGILGFLGRLNPKVLGAFVAAFFGLILAVQLASGAFAILSTAATIVSAILAGSVVGIIAGVVFGLAALVVALVIAYNSSETFRNIVNGSFRAVAAAGKYMWNEILKPVFEAFITAVEFLWKYAIKPYFTFILAYWRTVFNLMRGTWNNVLFPVLDLIAAIVAALWRNTFQRYLNFIGGIWSDVFGAMRAVWRNVLSPVFSAIGNAVGVVLVGAFRGAVAAIRTVWDGLRNIASAPIRFIIQTVLNDGLIGGFNWLADRFHTKHIPDIPLPKALQAAADGGVIRGKYLGPKVDNVLIRANPGEYVQQVAAVKHYGTKFMDDLNNRRIPRSDIPRYAAGGIVRPSKYPLGIGFGNTYSNGGFHSGQDFLSPMGGDVFSAMLGTVKRILNLTYSYGKHVIVGHPGGGETLYAHMSKIGVAIGQGIAAGQQLGLSGSTGHSSGPHLHFEIRSAPGGYSNAVDPLPYLTGAKDPGKGGGFHLPHWMTSPFGYVKDKVNGLLDKMGHSPYIELVKAMPKGALEMAKDAILGLGSKVGGAIIGGAKKVGSGVGSVLGKIPGVGGAGPMDGSQSNEGNGTMLYDNGGMLAPGITQVLNATGRPEPVFSPSQWAALHGNKGGGGGGSTPAVSIGQLVAADPDEAVSKIRRSQSDAAALTSMREIASGF
jgi:hypothetical protein